MDNDNCDDNEHYNAEDNVVPPRPAQGVRAVDNDNCDDNEHYNDEDNVVPPCPAQGVRAVDGTGINSSLLTWNSM